MPICSTPPRSGTRPPTGGGPDDERRNDSSVLDISASPRDFPGHRGLKILLRSLHVLLVAVLVGGSIVTPVA